ncbi:DUF5990 family protein [Streptacidiphilus sp. PAMC 29251]
MEIRVEATELPGRSCAAGPDFPGADNIHVGLQRKDRPGELLDLHPGDAPSARWTVPCTAVATPAGTELSGPYVQNRLGGRFLYLSWGSVDPAGEFSMFRRAKLMLDAVPADTLAAALRSGGLVARLPLTDAKGRPLCGRVPATLVHWAAAPAPAPQPEI